MKHHSKIINLRTVIIALLRLPDTGFDASLLKGYQEINVTVGHGCMGCISGVMDKLQETDTSLIIKNSIAINGTPYPIDDTCGIPSAIYHGTLEGLTGPSLNKFLRRMCFNGEAFKEFLNITPRRPLEELKEELAEIERIYLTQSYHLIPLATSGSGK